MLMNVKPAVRWLIAWGLCLVALGVFHFAFVAPRGRALTASRGDAVAGAKQFSFLKNAKSAREQERAKMEQQDLERQYSDFVFNSDEMNGLDFRIRSIAEKNGLWDFSSRHVATTSTLGTTKLQRVAQRELVLSFSCGFPDFLRFVNEMERHQPIMFVNQFTIRNVAGKEAGLSCDMECSVLYQTAGQ
jgi:hypothetical protein